jgi:hypothetical protein
VLGPRRDYKPYHGPRRTTTGALVRHAHAAAHHACHNPHHGVRPRTTSAPANIRVAASFGLVSWSLRRRRQDAALVAQPAAPGAPLPTYGRRHQARPLDGGARRAPWMAAPGAPLGRHARPPRAAREVEGVEGNGRRARVPPTRHQARRKAPVQHAVPPAAKRRRAGCVWA